MNHHPTLCDCRQCDERKVNAFVDEVAAMPKEKRLLVASVMRKIGEESDRSIRNADYSGLRVRLLALVRSFRIEPSLENVLQKSVDATGAK